MNIHKVKDKYNFTKLRKKHPPEITARDHIQLMNKKYLLAKT